MNGVAERRLLTVLARLQALAAAYRRPQSEDPSMIGPFLETIIRDALQEWE